MINIVTFVICDFFTYPKANIIHCKFRCEKDVTCHLQGVLGLAAFPLMAQPPTGTCHRPPKTDFENEKYIIILYLFCTPSPKFCTPFPLALSAIQIWGAGDMQPPQMQFQHKKLDHNFVLILYNFVQRVPNFVHHSLLRYQQFKFGGLVTCSPPNAIST